jgi:hypothetical protein
MLSLRLGDTGGRIAGRMTMTGSVFLVFLFFRILRTVVCNAASLCQTLLLILEV